MEKVYDDNSRRNAFKMLSIPGLIWAFTESNFATFVIPNTAFGVLGAVAGSRLADGQLSSLLRIVHRLPVVVAFNWYNVLVFDLANQRSTESVEEDLVNKPWRPIPSGKVTQDQTRRAMLATIPAALALNYLLGVWREGVFIQILTWLYNDLRGGDELIRDAIIAVAYGLFNHGSLQIAIGGEASVSAGGQIWIIIISGVILTTMQVQDLKDQEGDRTRGRKSIPLFLGDQTSRVLIAIFVLVWSCVCTFFWGLRPLAYTMTVSWGLVVMLSVLLRRRPDEDSQTWKLWCIWTVSLYSLPILASLTGN